MKWKLEIGVHKILENSYDTGIITKKYLDENLPELTIICLFLLSTSYAKGFIEDNTFGDNQEFYKINGCSTKYNEISISWVNYKTRTHLLFELIQNHGNYHERAFAFDIFRKTLMVI